MPEPSPISDLASAQREIDHLREELRKSAVDLATTREEARQKMHEFAREFRVPLATVLGFCDILSAKDKTHTTEWNQIAIASHQLKELIEDLERQQWQSPFESIHSDTPRPPSVPTVRTVLHIEDNETNFCLTKHILGDRPEINLLWASTGAEGVQSAARHMPSLILLDLNLPDIHGSDVLAQLRSDPATDKIPIVVLSADASPSRIERMLQAGAKDYLVKPFDIKQFLCIVDDALRPAKEIAA